MMFSSPERWILGLILLNHIMAEYKIYKLKKRVQELSRKEGIYDSLY